MLRLRVKSSLSASRTAVMSPFTSSKTMMSSTRAELIFTLAAWPLALAWRMKRWKEAIHRGKTQILDRWHPIPYPNGRCTHVNSRLRNLLTDLLPSSWRSVSWVQRGRRWCWGAAAVRGAHMWPPEETWAVATGTDTAEAAADAGDSQTYLTPETRGKDIVSIGENLERHVRVDYKHNAGRFEITNKSIKLYTNQSKAPLGRGSKWSNSSFQPVGGRHMSSTDNKEPSSIFFLPTRRWFPSKNRNKIRKQ